MPKNGYDFGCRKLARSRQRRRTPTPSTRRLAWLIGPALVAGVAYLDPGNVASNMTAGARYGYLLVWVVVLGNVMAWLIQYLSAKLGIVTGRSLPETLGRRIRNRGRRRAYWLQAELVAMATDIAEVIGGAVALNLLFGIPLLWGGVITGTVSTTAAGVKTLTTSSHSSQSWQFDGPVRRPVRPPTRLRAARRGPVRRPERTSARPRERRSVRRTARTTSGSRDAGPSSSSDGEPHHRDVALLGREE